MTALFFIFLILLIIYFVIRPIKIKFLKISLNIITVPIIALLIALATHLIDFELILKGVIGNGVTQPWKVLVIFFGSAFISVSADRSGIFDYFSVSVLNRGKGRGILLFIITYCFAWLLSVFASNDIVILTLTPIIFYFSIYSNVNVLPLLFAEFIAANNGIFFITGNPVDTIIATALNIDQISYIQITILPTIVLSVVSLVLLYFFFRKKITRKYEVRDLKRPVDSWIDANASWIILLFTVALLITSSFLKLEIWMVVLIGVFAFIIKDLIVPFFYKHKLFEEVYGKFWRLYRTIYDMPWEIFPFILTMFIFVTAMDYYNFFDSISLALSQLVQHSVWGASFGFGFLSLFTENIINNQPMAIIFSNIFTNSFFQVSPQILKASVFSVVLAGNAGASLTIVGSLAGLMWKKILKQRGTIITHGQFAKVGFATVLPAVLISFLVLALIL